MRGVHESTLPGDTGDLVSAEPRIAQTFGARIQTLTELAL
jgi:hypothetical protein